MLPRSQLGSSNWSEQKGSFEPVSSNELFFFFFFFSCSSSFSFALFARSRKVAQTVRRANERLICMHLCRSFSLFRLPAPSSLRTLIPAERQWSPVSVAHPSVWPAGRPAPQSEPLPREHARSLKEL